MKLEFSLHILKNIQISNFMQIHPVGAQLFHATDRKHYEANCHFSQFCKRTQKSYTFTQP